MYIEGLADADGIDEYVITPLMREEARDFIEIRQLMSKKISVSRVNEFHTFSTCSEYLSSGNPILLLDNEAIGLAVLSRVQISKWKQ
jgi:hypothetical protein